MEAKGFNEAFDFVVGAEGGFGNDPNDRGNWTTGIIGEGECKGTKFGISAMSYPDMDIEQLSLIDARDIYCRHYWRPMYCELLSYAQAVCLFDCAVNQGKRRSAKFAQRAACVTADGIMGMQTIGAMHRMKNNLFVDCFLAEREKHYRLLSTFDRYGKGWMNRLDHVSKEAGFPVAVSYTLRG